MASAPAAYASRMVLPPSMQGSLPAGWLAFTGRELNPLDRDEGFQITSSSSLPGLFLAQHPKTCTKADFNGQHALCPLCPIADIIRLLFRTVLQYGWTAAL
jgi:hypothetical protein